MSNLSPGLYRRPDRWYRNAGARRYHFVSAGWIETGRGLCGADISHPYVEGFAPVEGTFVQLADYPKRFGMVYPCKHCLKRLKGRMSDASV